MLFLAVQYNKETDSFNFPMKDLFKDRISTNESLQDLFGSGIEWNKVKNWDRLFDKKKIIEYREEIKNFAEDTNYATKDLASFKQYMFDNGKAVTGFQSVVKAAGTGLKSFAATLGSMAAMWAIGEVVSLIVSGLDKLVNSAKYAKEAAEGFSSSYETLQKDISDNSSKISELNAKYQELSEGVNNLGENVSLTKDEYKEYKDVVSQISDIMPDLNTRFNDQGEKIGFVQGKLKDLNSEYDKYQQAQAKKLINDGDDDENTASDAFKNYKNLGVFYDSKGKHHESWKLRADKNYRKKIEEAQKQLDILTEKYGSDRITENQEAELEKLSFRISHFKTKIKWVCQVKFVSFFEFLLVVKSITI